MNTKEARRRWGISADQFNKMMDFEAIPVVDGIIPSDIENIVIVDRRYNMINSLDFSQTILVILILVRCGYYFNAKLLNMHEDNFIRHIDYLLENELVEKHNDYCYRLSLDGRIMYEKYKTKDIKYLRMLLGSVKINRKIIDRMEYLL